MRPPKDKFFKYLVFTVIVLSFLFLPFLPLKDIDFQGNQYISTETLNKELESYKNKHVIKLLVFKSISKHIHKAFVEVENISISYTFPTKLTVTIDEKKPWVLCISAGQSWLIAEDGTVINTSENIVNNDESLLIIKGLNQNYFQDKYINETILNEIAMYNEILGDHFLDQKLMIETDNLYHITLVLDDDIQVFLGEFINSNQKLKELKRFLTYLPKDKFAKLDYIDLRVDNKVYVKYGT